MKCMICNKKTKGSIGAAGISWPNICQPCKDDADNSLKTALLEQQHVFRKIMQYIGK